ncbi:TrmH family RNA methyltransferase [Patescibacteria group bacterium]|nr:TrmH family RNA methyltransferase [Patescibacteria group bacterium]
MVKLNAKQLRSYQSSAISRQQSKKNEIYIILDNVLDTYNIGSIFRLADAVGAKKIFLCGQTETPPNHRIKKASINTTEWVEWEYCETAQEAVSRVKREGERVKIIAIEQSTKSTQYNTFDYKLPVCLIVGNETTGVSKEVLEMADGIVEIPMFGVNISLNVMVSLAIVLYKVIDRSKSFGLKYKMEKEKVRKSRQLSVISRQTFV